MIKYVGGKIKRIYTHPFKLKKKIKIKRIIKHEKKISVWKKLYLNLWKALEKK